MKIILITLCTIASFFCLADNNEYRYSVNLTKVINDRLSVKLLPPLINTHEIDFMFPAMVPGTYEVYDFGRFISNFKVSGRNGEVIKFKKINVNTYRIWPADKIEQISYDVDDTFDKSDLPGTKDKIVFEPGGTNIEEGRNFCINTHCLFGYFAGMTGKKFIIEFEKPKGFYPCTGLTNIELGETKDLISVSGYHSLVDSPIMYFLPDTATVGVANTKVLVACYSPNKIITAGFIAGTLTELLLAQRNYLGGELPVDKYAFLFYFTGKPTLSQSHGALEHSYSSFYVMPELDSLVLQQQLRDVCAHEFFHIVTPLTIHAREIGDFDFNKPEMSEHLWLYEGMTEYAAHHAQLKTNIITIEDFMNTMMQKYETSLQLYNDTMSFTYMSKHVLEQKIHKQYANVYEKGALIGLCLDILLRDLSNGAYGTQNLMKDLAGKYGRNISFEDKNLFNDIEKFTYPEIGDFLKNHVSGKTPLPIQQVLAKIGINFVEKSTGYEFTLGNPDLDYNPKTSRIRVESIKHLDAFGKELGYKKRDELYKLNGKILKPEQLREIISDYYSELSVGSEVKIEVYRSRFLGRRKLTTLSAKAIKVEIEHKNKLQLLDTISEKQKNTLKAWAGIEL